MNYCFKYFNLIPPPIQLIQLMLASTCCLSGLPTEFPVETSQMCSNICFLQLYCDGFAVSNRLCLGVNPTLAEAIGNRQHCVCVMCGPSFFLRSQSCWMSPWSWAASWLEHSSLPKATWSLRRLFLTLSLFVTSWLSFSSHPQVTFLIYVIMFKLYLLNTYRLLL